MASPFAWCQCLATTLLLLCAGPTQQQSIERAGLVLFPDAGVGVQTLEAGRGEPSATADAFTAFTAGGSDQLTNSDAGGLAGGAGRLQSDGAPLDSGRLVFTPSRSTNSIPGVLPAPADPPVQAEKLRRLKAYLQHVRLSQQAERAEALRRAKLKELGQRGASAPSSLTLASPAPAGASLAGRVKFEGPNLNRGGINSNGVLQAQEELRKVLQGGNLLTGPSVDQQPTLPTVDSVRTSNPETFQARDELRRLNLDSGAAPAEADVSRQERFRLPSPGTVDRPIQRPAATSLRQGRAELPPLIPKASKSLQSDQEPGDFLAIRSDDSLLQPTGVSDSGVRQDSFGPLNSRFTRSRLFELSKTRPLRQKSTITTDSSGTSGGLVRAPTSPFDAVTGETQGFTAFRAAEVGLNGSDEDLSPASHPRSGTVPAGADLASASSGIRVWIQTSDGVVRAMELVGVAAPPSDEALDLQPTASSPVPTVVGNDRQVHVSDPPAFGGALEESDLTLENVSIPVVSADPVEIVNGGSAYLLAAEDGSLYVITAQADRRSVAEEPQVSADDPKRLERDSPAPISVHSSSINRRSQNQRISGEPLPLAAHSVTDPVPAGGSDPVPVSSTQVSDPVPVSISSAGATYVYLNVVYPAPRSDDLPMKSESAEGSNDGNSDNRESTESSSDSNSGSLAAQDTTRSAPLRVDDRGIFFFPGDVIHSFGIAPSASGQMVMVTPPQPGVPSRLISSHNQSSPIALLLMVPVQPPTPPAHSLTPAPSALTPQKPPTTLNGDLPPSNEEILASSSIIRPAAVAVRPLTSPPQHPTQLTASSSSQVDRLDTFDTVLTSGGTPPNRLPLPARPQPASSQVLFTDVSDTKATGLSGRPPATPPPQTGFSGRPLATQPPQTGFNSRPPATPPPQTGFNSRPLATLPLQTGFNSRPLATQPPQTGFSGRPLATPPPQTGFSGRPLATQPPQTGFKFPAGDSEHAEPSDNVLKFSSSSPAAAAASPSSFLFSSSAGGQPSSQPARPPPLPVAAPASSRLPVLPSEAGVAGSAGQCRPEPDCSVSRRRRGCSLASDCPLPQNCCFSQCLGVSVCQEGTVRDVAAAISRLATVVQR